MKKFLTKTSILTLLIIVIHYGLAFMADGYSDPYYVKLSSSKQTALILGASRANEGIMPTVIDSVFSIKHNKKGLFNYAFTNSDSPYGAVYLNAIKQKIKDGTTNSVFILSVHPWNISSRNKNPNDEEKFRENNLSLANITHFNNSPNYDYLLNGYQYGWGNLVLKKMENKIFEKLGANGMLKDGAWSYVHDDGWLEVKFLNKDSMFFVNKTNQTIAKIKKNDSYIFSQKRLDYLKETIEQLNNFGSVYLVRMPVDKRVLEMENKIMPKFDNEMDKLANQDNIKYLNFSSCSEDYQYSDGSHFVKESAVKFSVELAFKILNDL